MSVETSVMQMAGSYLLYTVLCISDKNRTQLSEITEVSLRRYILHSALRIHSVEYTDDDYKMIRNIVASLYYHLDKPAADVSIEMYHYVPELLLPELLLSSLERNSR